MPLRQIFNALRPALLKALLFQIFNALRPAILNVLLCQMYNTLLSALWRQRYIKKREGISAKHPPLIMPVMSTLILLSVVDCQSYAYLKGIEFRSFALLEHL